MLNKKKVMCISFLNALNIHIICNVQRCCILLIIEHIQHQIPYMYVGVCVLYVLNLALNIYMGMIFCVMSFTILHSFGGEKFR